MWHNIWHKVSLGLNLIQPFLGLEPNIYMSYHIHILFGRSDCSLCTAQYIRLSVTLASHGQLLLVTHFIAEFDQFIFPEMVKPVFELICGWIRHNMFGELHNITIYYYSPAKEVVAYISSLDSLFLALFNLWL